MRELKGAQRRYATQFIFVAEATATVIDEIVKLPDRIVGWPFDRAK